MAIASFPTALQGIIQQGFLERQFRDSLRSSLVFRSVADREIFPNKVGETITKTRSGLKAPVTTPLNPASNTNLDNGLTPASWTMEQFTLSVSMFGDTMDLNTVTQGVGIQRQFVTNAGVNGYQAGQSVDRLARLALFNAYMSGNTKVTATLGAPATTIAVDDVRGFQYMPVNGVMAAVSPSNQMGVTVNGVAHTLNSVTVDGSNTSTLAAVGGISGTLTMSANVSVANGTLNNAVVSNYAPTVLRAGGRATTTAITGSDLLTMGLILDGVTQLRNNNVPTIDGLYNCYLDPKSQRELFTDPDFKLLFQGATSAAEEFRRARVIELLDVRFLPTTEAIQQTIGSVGIHRPIIVGQGALVEGVYEDTGYQEIAGQGLVFVSDGIAQVIRPPVDRLNQIIAQSWYYIGGFVAPTDITATQSIIPTASTAFFKRAVMLEHA